MKDLLYLFLFSVFVMTCIGLDCPTCQGLECFKSRIPNIQCQRNYPELPFPVNFIPKRGNRNNQYGCLELQYYAGKAVYGIKQCLPVIPGNCICEQFKKILQIKQCRFSENRQQINQENENIDCEKTRNEKEKREAAKDKNTEEERKRKENEYKQSEKREKEEREKEKKERENKMKADEEKKKAEAENKRKADEEKKKAEAEKNKYENKLKENSNKAKNGIAENENKLKEEEKSNENQQNNKDYLPSIVNIVSWLAGQSSQKENKSSIKDSQLDTLPATKNEKKSTDNKMVPTPTYEATTINFLTSQNKNNITEVRTTINLPITKITTAVNNIKTLPTKQHTESNVTQKPTPTIFMDDHFFHTLKANNSNKNSSYKNTSKQNNMPTVIQKASTSLKTSKQSTKTTPFGNNLTNTLNIILNNFSTVSLKSSTNVLTNTPSSATKRTTLLNKTNKSTSHIPTTQNNPVISNQKKTTTVRNNVSYLPIKTITGADNNKFEKSSSTQRIIIPTITPKVTTSGKTNSGPTTKQHYSIFTVIKTTTTTEIPKAATTFESNSHIPTTQTNPLISQQVTTTFPTTDRTNVNNNKFGKNSSTIQHDILTAIQGITTSITTNANLPTIKTAKPGNNHKLDKNPSTQMIITGARASSPTTKTTSAYNNSKTNKNSSTQRDHILAITQKVTTSILDDFAFTPTINLTTAKNNNFKSTQENKVSIPKQKVNVGDIRDKTSLLTIKPTTADDNYKAENNSYTQNHILIAAQEKTTNVLGDVTKITSAINKTYKTNQSLFTKQTDALTTTQNGATSIIKDSLHLSTTKATDFTSGQHLSAQENNELTARPKITFGIVADVTTSVSTKTNNMDNNYKPETNFTTAATSINNTFKNCTMHQNCTTTQKIIISSLPETTLLLTTKSAGAENKYKTGPTSIKQQNELLTTMQKATTSIKPDATSPLTSKQKGTTSITLDAMYMPTSKKNSDYDKYNTYQNLPIQQDDVLTSKDKSITSIIQDETSLPTSKLTTVNYDISKETSAYNNKYESDTNAPIQDVFTITKKDTTSVITTQVYNKVVKNDEFKLVDAITQTESQIFGTEDGVKIYFLDNNLPIVDPFSMSSFTSSTTHPRRIRKDCTNFPEDKLPSTDTSLRNEDVSITTNLNKNGFRPSNIATIKVPITSQQNVETSSEKFTGATTQETKPFKKDPALVDTTYIETTDSGTPKIYEKEEGNTVFIIRSSAKPQGTNENISEVTKSFSITDDTAQLKVNTNTYDSNVDSPIISKENFTANSEKSTIPTKESSKVLKSTLNPNIIAEAIVPDLKIYNESDSELKILDEKNTHHQMIATTKNMGISKSTLKPTDFINGLTKPQKPKTMIPTILEDQYLANDEQTVPSTSDNVKILNTDNSPTPSPNGNHQIFMNNKNTEMLGYLSAEESIIINNKISEKGFYEPKSSTVSDESTTANGRETTQVTYDNTEFSLSDVTTGMLDIDLTNVYATESMYSTLPDNLEFDSDLEISTEESNTAYANHFTEITPDNDEIFISSKNTEMLEYSSAEESTTINIETSKNGKGIYEPKSLIVSDKSTIENRRKTTQVTYDNTESLLSDVTREMLDIDLTNVYATESMYSTLPDNLKFDSDSEISTEESNTAYANHFTEITPDNDEIFINNKNTEMLEYSSAEESTTINIKTSKNGKGFYEAKSSIVSDKSTTESEGETTQVTYDNTESLISDVITEMMDTDFTNVYATESMYSTLPDHLEFNSDSEISTEESNTAYANQFTEITPDNDEIFINNKNTEMLEYSSVEESKTINIETSKNGNGFYDAKSLIVSDKSTIENERETTQVTYDNIESSLSDVTTGMFGIDLTNVYATESIYSTLPDNSELDSDSKISTEESNTACANQFTEKTSNNDKIFINNKNTEMLDYLSAKESTTINIVTYKNGKGFYEAKSSIVSDKSTTENERETIQVTYDNTESLLSDVTTEMKDTDLTNIYATESMYSTLPDNLEFNSDSEISTEESNTAYANQFTEITPDNDEIFINNKNTEMLEYSSAKESTTINIETSKNGNGFYDAKSLIVSDKGTTENERETTQVTYDNTESSLSDVTTGMFGIDLTNVYATESIYSTLPDNLEFDSDSDISTEESNTAYANQFTEITPDNDKIFINNKNTEKLDYLLAEESTTINTVTYKNGKGFYEAKSSIVSDKSTTEHERETIQVTYDNTESLLSDVTTEMKDTDLTNIYATESMYSTLPDNLEFNSDSEISTEESNTAYANQFTEITPDNDEIFINNKNTEMLEYSSAEESTTINIKTSKNGNGFYDAKSLIVSDKGTTENERETTQVTYDNTESSLSDVTTGMFGIDLTNVYSTESIYSTLPDNSELDSDSEISTEESNTAYANQFTEKTPDNNEIFINNKNTEMLEYLSAEESTTINIETSTNGKGFYEAKLSIVSDKSTTENEREITQVTYDNTESLLSDVTTEMVDTDLTNVYATESMYSTLLDNLEFNSNSEISTEESNTAYANHFTEIPSDNNEIFIDNKNTEMLEYSSAEESTTINIKTSKNGNGFYDAKSLIVSDKSTTENERETTQVTYDNTESLISDVTTEMLDTDLTNVYVTESMYSTLPDNLEFDSDSEITTEESNTAYAIQFTEITPDNHEISINNKNTEMLEYLSTEESTTINIETSTNGKGFYEAKLSIVSDKSTAENERETTQVTYDNTESLLSNVTTEMLDTDLTNIYATESMYSTLPKNLELDLDSEISTEEGNTAYANQFTEITPDNDEIFLNNKNTEMLEYSSAEESTTINIETSKNGNGFYDAKSLIVSDKGTTENERETTQATYDNTESSLSDVTTGMFGIDLTNVYATESMYSTLPDNLEFDSDSEISTEESNTAYAIQFTEITPDNHEIFINNKNTEMLEYLSAEESTTINIETSTNGKGFYEAKLSIVSDKSTTENERETTQVTYDNTESLLSDVTTEMMDTDLTNVYATESMYSTLLDNLEFNSDSEISTEESNTAYANHFTEIPSDNDEIFINNKNTEMFEYSSAEESTTINIETSKNGNGFYDAKSLIVSDKSTTENERETTQVTYDNTESLISDVTTEMLDTDLTNVYVTESMYSTLPDNLEFDSDSEISTEESNTAYAIQFTEITPDNHEISINNKNTEMLEYLSAEESTIINIKTSTNDKGFYEAKLSIVSDKSTTENERETTQVTYDNTESLLSDVTTEMMDTDLTNVYATESMYSTLLDNLKFDSDSEISTEESHTAYANHFTEIPSDNDEIFINNKNTEMLEYSSAEESTTINIETSKNGNGFYDAKSLIVSDKSTTENKRETTQITYDNTESLISDITTEMLDTDLTNVYVTESMYSTLPDNLEFDSDSEISTEESNTAYAIQFTEITPDNHEISINNKNTEMLEYLSAEESTTINIETFTNDKGFYEAKLSKVPDKSTTENERETTQVTYDNTESLISDVTTEMLDTDLTNVYVTESMYSTLPDNLEFDSDSEISTEESNTAYAIQFTEITPDNHEISINNKNTEMLEYLSAEESTIINIKTSTNDKGFYEAKLSIVSDKSTTENERETTQVTYDNTESLLSDVTTEMMDTDLTNVYATESMYSTLLDNLKFDSDSEISTEESHTAYANHFTEIPSDNDEIFINNKNTEMLEYSSAEESTTINIETSKNGNGFYDAKSLIVSDKSTTENKRETTQITYDNTESLISDITTEMLDTDLTNVYVTESMYSTFTDNLEFDSDSEISTEESNTAYAIQFTEITPDNHEISINNKNTEMLEYLSAEESTIINIKTSTNDKGFYEAKLSIVSDKSTTENERETTQVTYDNTESLLSDVTTEMMDTDLTNVYATESMYSTLLDNLKFDSDSEISTEESHTAYANHFTEIPSDNDEIFINNKNTEMLEYSSAEESTTINIETSKNGNGFYDAKSLIVSDKSTTENKRETTQITYDNTESLISDITTEMLDTDLTNVYVTESMYSTLPDNLEFDSDSEISTEESNTAYAIQFTEITPDNHEISINNKNTEMLEYLSAEESTTINIETFTNDKGFYEAKLSKVPDKSTTENERETTQVTYDNTESLLSDVTTEMLDTDLTNIYVTESMYSTLPENLELDLDSEISTEEGNTAYANQFTEITPDNDEIFINNKNTEMLEYSSAEESTTINIETSENGKGFYELKSVIVSDESTTANEREATQVAYDNSESFLSDVTTEMLETKDSVPERMHSTLQDKYNYDSDSEISIEKNDTEITGIIYSNPSRNNLVWDSLIQTGGSETASTNQFTESKTIEESVESTLTDDEILLSLLNLELLVSASDRDSLDLRPSNSPPKMSETSNFPIDTTETNSFSIQTISKMNSASTITTGKIFNIKPTTETIQQTPELSSSDIGTSEEVSYSSLTVPEINSATITTIGKIFSTRSTTQLSQNGPEISSVATDTIGKISNTKPIPEETNSFYETSKKSSRATITTGKVFNTRSTTEIIQEMLQTESRSTGTTKNIFSTSSTIEISQQTPDIRTTEKLVSTSITTEAILSSQKILGTTSVSAVITEEGSESEFSNCDYDMINSSLRTVPFMLVYFLSLIMGILNSL